MHRLLQKVVRDDARARGDASAVTRAVAALDHAFPSDPSDSARWPLSEQLLAHVIALADAAADVPETAPQVIELLNRACHYLIWAEGGARGLALAQRTVEKANEHPRRRASRHADRPQTVRRSRIDRPDARPEAILSRCSRPERILGAEHPDTLGTRYDLAGAYERRRVAEAIAIFEPLLADRAGPRRRAPQHPHHPQ